MNAAARVGRIGLSVCFCLLLCSSAYAQSPRVLYTFGATDNIRDWLVTGDFEVGFLENTVDGELTYVEANGASDFAVLVHDGWNALFEDTLSQSGLDVTGLEAIEFDLGHDGDETVAVQFFVQATPDFEYVALGEDQLIEPDGVRTYSAPLADLNQRQIAHLKTIGFNIRPHPEQGDLTWTLEEVRSAGEPLQQRDFATHDPGTPDNGLNGAFVNFDASAVEGNDGGQNQTGLRHNTSDLPPGNTGSLQWTDLASGNGVAMSWVNGTEHRGNSWDERPTDLSNYSLIRIRIAATNIDGAVDELGLDYFLQTSGATSTWTFRLAGPAQFIPVDGEFHELDFPIGSLADLKTVETHGINLQGHPGGDLIIDVDNIRAIAPTEFADCNDNDLPDERDVSSGTSLDCNVNGIPDECDLASGVSADCNENGVPDECDIADQNAVRILYTWEGTGDTRGWGLEADPGVEAFFANDPEGELTVIEESTEPGSGIFFGDHPNIISEGGASEGGLDILGKNTLEVDMGHDGAGDITVQVFVQSTADFLYSSIGGLIVPGGDVATYALSFNLAPEHATYIRRIGFNVFGHTDVGNVAWTIREIRVIGTALTQRDYATHEPGSSDDGLQGAIVNFDNAAIQGNDGAQNQTGLSHNTSDSPPGNTGSLQWTDLPGEGGGAISWHNGTSFDGDSFNERPTDMSTYNEIVVRMAATNMGGTVESVGVEYFLQTGNFNYFAAGAIQSLPVDGEFHELVFPLDGIEDLQFVDAHGINLDEHDDGALVIDVDNVRARGPGSPEADSNGDRIPDECVPAEIFKRGDSNANGTLDIGDPIINLGHQFLGDQVVCRDALDYNDSGTIDISDPVANLSHQFLGLAPPAEPGKEVCGPDPTEEDPLECAAYPPENC